MLQSRAVRSRERGDTMSGFKDPAPAARAAIVALSTYAVVDLATMVVAYFAPPDFVEWRTADSFFLADFTLLFACMVLVGRWIYRTNANAHAFSDGLAITPGWAVGWFFVPIANLVKPYEGVKEVWDVSHELAGRYDEVGSPLLGLWWGLWIATNIGSGVSAQLGRFAEPSNSALLIFDIVVAIVNVPLCLVLIQLIRRLSATQKVVHRAEAFA
jgi:hypothetical protein